MIKYNNNKIGSIILIILVLFLIQLFLLMLSLLQGIYKYFLISELDLVK